MYFPPPPSAPQQHFYQPLNDVTGAISLGMNDTYFELPGCSQISLTRALEGETESAPPHLFFPDV